MENKRVIIVGGGAAGYFAAVNAAMLAPQHDYLILEQSPSVLGKVKISGGGRCNVTHACFEPKELTKAYPRGNKALLGPFTRFMTGDVMGWFEDREVPLKIEEDGRVFPISDQSQSIIDCLSQAAKDHKVQVKTRQQVQDVRQESDKWVVQTKENVYLADMVLIATGSNKAIWQKLEQLGHTVISPVPSLFTFNIKDPRIEGLQGISVEDASLSVVGSKLKDKGPLLITHWGLSGPAILKLSAWGARELFDRHYSFQLKVNWLGEVKKGKVLEELASQRKRNPKKVIHGQALFDMPGRLWKSFCLASSIQAEQRWADLSKVQQEYLATELTEGIFKVKGKSTFKDEFVTAGGIKLDEVNFKTMESKRFPGLFFAGEVLDIDAITGGYNFQAAWTTAWIAAQHITTL